MDLRAPRVRLLLALLLPLALVAPWALGRLGPTSGARALLAAAAVGGLGLWLRRQRAAGQGATAAPPPLRVLARVGLTARGGLALVEADGRRYVASFGEAPVQLHPLEPATVPAARRRWAGRPLRQGLRAGGVR